MQKAGRKLLAEVEREGRHAVVEMHSPGPRPSPLLLLQQQQQQQQQNGLGPAAPAAAAAAEPQDSQAVPSSLLRSGEFLGRRVERAGVWGWSHG